MEYIPDNYDQLLIHERALEEQEETNEQFISDNREL